MNYPEKLYVCEPLCQTEILAGTPDEAGQERLAFACGYRGDDLDCLLAYDMDKLELLRTWKGQGLYGRFRRGGCNNMELWRVYYTARLADDEYYDVRQIRDIKIYGIGVCRSVRGHRRR